MNKNEKIVKKTKIPFSKLIKGKMISNKNLSPEIKKDILSKDKRWAKLNVMLDKYAKDNIMDLNHMLDVTNLLELATLTNDELYKMIQDNLLLKRIIETHDERKRKEIIRNIEFLNEANHTEKTALVWMYIMSIMTKSLDNFNILIEQKKIKELRNTYPLTEPNINLYQSAALFSKFGVFEQEASKTLEFSREKYSKKNEKVFQMSVDKLYSIIPEMEKIYNPDSNAKNGINYYSLIPSTINLNLAAKWLLQKIGFIFN